MTMETDKGFIGLWSCWLENRFCLCVPYNIPIDLDLVKKTLGLYTSVEVGLSNEWGILCSDRIESTTTRFWVDVTQRDSIGVQFPYISKLNEVESIYYGHDYAQMISNTGYCLDDRIDGPNSKPEVTNLYRDKFIELLLEISKPLGIKSLHLSFQTLGLEPNDLFNLGYKNVKYDEYNSKRHYFAELNEEKVILNKCISGYWVTTKNIQKTEYTLSELIGLLSI